jgi:hypothetical protein
VKDTTLYTVTAKSASNNTDVAIFPLTVLIDVTIYMATAVTVTAVMYFGKFMGIFLERIAPCHLK